MKITFHMLNDFFFDQGWTVLQTPVRKNHCYESVRLFYSGIRFQPNVLYVAQVGNELPGEITPNLCLLGRANDQMPKYNCYLVDAPCSLMAFYSAIADFFEALERWDRELVELLLNDGSLQEVLNISAAFLRSPCFFEDANYNVLAHWGEPSIEENPFFYHAIHNGRPPMEFFEKLLMLPESDRMQYTSTGRVTLAKHFSRHGELLSTCIVNGVAVIHFCLICTTTRIEGLRDIITHLMRRVESGPGIRAAAETDRDAYDILFSDIIADPADLTAARAMKTLNLQRYGSFAVICIDFGERTEKTSSTLSRLRFLYPFDWFFTYHDHPYALIGVKPGAGHSSEKQNHPILNNLEDMGARFGISHVFSEISTLSAACSQAACALAAGSLGADAWGGIEKRDAYQDWMLSHMVVTFFEQHPFHAYCPRNFLALQSDDQKTGNHNIRLLFTYLSNNCNATAVAKLLHMHRNNVIYRIEKLKVKYNLDLDNHIQRTLLLLLCTGLWCNCDQYPT